MTIKVEKKITGYEVSTGQSNQVQTAQVAVASANQDHPLDRPEKLIGNTYKVKTPVTEHALYITINDVVVGEGTEQEHRRPFEIFINSKNMEHFQWIVALTRVMSAVFRKGGDVTFLVEELQSVFDPAGGYFKKGGKFTPSLVAEIGEVVERHLQEIGMLKKSEPDEHQRKLIAEKKAEYLDKQSKSTCDESGDIPGAQLCEKCNTKAVVVLDGCKTCLSCGNSKCS